MSTKTKNALIHAITYILSGAGGVLILVFQYFSRENQSPTAIKIAIPCLIGLLILFLVYFKAIKQRISRKLTAIETAKELGMKGKTSEIVANLLEAIGILIPLALIATIFTVGGKYLEKTGVVLFEMLGMYIVIVIGNIVCDVNSRLETAKKTEQQAEEIAEKIASKLTNFKKYE